MYALRSVQCLSVWSGKSYFQMHVFTAHDNILRVQNCLIRDDTYEYFFSIGNLSRLDGKKTNLTFCKIFKPQILMYQAFQTIGVKETRMINHQKIRKISYGGHIMRNTSGHYKLFDTLLRTIEGRLAMLHARQTRKRETKVNIGRWSRRLVQSGLTQNDTTR